MHRSRLAVAAALTLAVGGLTPVVAASAATPAPPAPPASTPVTTQLTPVSDLQVSASAKGERLHWVDPAGDYAGVVVRRAPGHLAPASPTSGTAVATLPRGAASMTDASVQTSAIYSYAVFAMYSGGRHAAAAVRHAATSAVVTPGSARGGSFTGTVTDTDGHPLQGVFVTATPAPEVAPVGVGGVFFGFGIQGAQARTASDGTYTLSGTARASYLICYSSENKIVTGGNSTQMGYQDVCPPDAVEGHASGVVSLGTTVLAPSTGGLVTGTVVDANTNAPIRGVQVEPETDIPVFAATTAQGTFRLPIPAGTYTFCYDAEISTSATDETGYVSECKDSVPVVVTVGQVTHVQVALAVGGAITGVVKGTDGSPIEGIDVSSGYSDGLTGPDGTYRLIGLATGRVHICGLGFFAFPTDSAPDGYGISCVVAGATVGRTRSASDIVLPAAGGVSGTVTTASGKPLPGAVVVAFQRRLEIQTNTDRDGTYFIPDMAPGKAFVCFYAVTYPSQCYNDRTGTQRPTPIVVASAVTTSGIDASLAGRDPGRVSALIADTHGHPLIGADAVLVQRCDDQTEGCSPVSIFAKPRNTAELGGLTNASGRISFGGVAAGTYALCAFGRYAVGGSSSTRYQDGCTGTEYTIVVRSGATTQVELDLADGAAVSGTVTDSRGRPIAGVYVRPSTGDDVDGSWLMDGPVTGADGTYQVDGLPAGTTTICFEAYAAHGASLNGYASQCYNDTSHTPTPIPVTNGVVTTGIDATLKQAGAVTGRVTGVDGQPVADVEVYAQGASKFEGGFASTGPDGTYRIIGLPAGTYAVCFEAEAVADAPPTGYVSQCYDNVVQNAPTPVAVHAGYTTGGIDAQLAAGAEITGQITVDGQPADYVDALLIMRTPTGGFGIVEFVTGGEYEFTGLPTGKYVLCVDGSGAGASRQCYDNVAWTGRRIPAGLTRIVTTPGQTVSIDFALTSVS